MKLLAADIGNTNVTIGLFEDDRIGPLVAGHHAGERDCGRGRRDAHCRCSRSTATDSTARCRRPRERRAPAHRDLGAPRYRAHRREPAIIDAASLEGILDMRIDRPAEAGADRFANALAARIEFGGPAIVIDLGTSTNSTSWTPTVPTSAARSRRALASASRRSSAAPASCRASSCAGLHRRSAPTPCMPCSPAPCSGISAWSAAC